MAVTEKGHGDYQGEGHLMKKMGSTDLFIYLRIYLFLTFKHVMPSLYSFIQLLILTVYHTFLSLR